MIKSTNSLVENKLIMLFCHINEIFMTKYPINKIIIIFLRLRILTCTKRKQIAAYITISKI